MASRSTCIVFLSQPKSAQKVAPHGSLSLQQVFLGDTNDSILTNQPKELFLATPKNVQLALTIFDVQKKKSLQIHSTNQSSMEKRQHNKIFNQPSHAPKTTKKKSGFCWEKIQLSRFISSRDTKSEFLPVQHHAPLPGFWFPWVQPNYIGWKSNHHFLYGYHPKGVSAFLKWWLIP